MLEAITSAASKSPIEPALTRLRILELIQRKSLTADVGRLLLQELGSSSSSGTAASNGVAVIGMSGRFADAPDLDALWTNLSSGRDSVREVPAHRWNPEEHWSTNHQAPGKTYCKWGSVLEDVDQFDPSFFNMSPREARLMDPQQRIFLMEAWRAVEDAGYSDRSLSESDCSVFVGAAAGDYQNLLRQSAVPPEGYTLTGTNTAMLSSRIAYHLNLRGPSLTVDTSCSSSMMAVHLACDAIREGRCGMALAGGVAVLATPELYVLASKAGMLSSDGCCRPFDRNANGFVPGEGVGVVLLKDLAAALRDGDHVYAVIAGSCTNQDGKTNGITAPSGPAQTALEIQTYTRFGVNPLDITYVECHGTGTRLGDPIEIQALTSAFGQFTDRRQYCALGSIKSNLGHCLTAAGIAGLLKVLLSIKHQQLVPSLHVERLNSLMRIEESPFFVNTELREWKTAPGVPRKAAISSFGFSGTNVHAVVQDPPAQMRRNSANFDQLQLFLLSSKTEEALRERLIHLENWLVRDAGSNSWGDIAYTLSAGRSHFPVRAAFVAADPQDLREQIGRSLRRELSRSLEGSETVKQTAAAYLAGSDVDWLAMYTPQHHRRVSLPTYPFARERYWIPDGDATSALKCSCPEQTVPLTAASAKDGGSAARTHPIPMTAGEQVVFHRKIGPDEPLVQDHVVSGRPLLPAAGHLSIAYQFLTELLGSRAITVTRALFVRPIFVDRMLDITITITALSEGSFGYEVQSAGPDGAPQKCSSGQASLAAKSDSTLNIDEVRNRCTHSTTAETLYKRFSGEGIQYGPYFKTVQQIWHHKGEVLAEVAHCDLEHGLSAGPLDGAIQSAAILEWETQGVHLPFAMDRVEISKAISPKSFVHILKGSAGSCNINIADAQGKSCVAIQGFSYRPMKQPLATRIYVPEWQELPPNGEPQRLVQNVLIVAPDNAFGLDRLLADHHSGAEVVLIPSDSAALDGAWRDVLARIGHPDLIYFLGGVAAGCTDPLSLDLLEQMQQQGIRSLYGLVRALLGSGQGAPNLHLRVITSDSHWNTGDTAAQPHAATMFGFCKSLAKEQPTWGITCVDISSSELSSGATNRIVTSLVNEAPNGNGDEVLLRNAHRYRRVLRELDPSPSRQAAFRRQGVYLIVGGAGGIGSELALYLARTVQARLILIGRRERNPEIDGKCHLIEAAGGHALYIQADATDSAQMSLAVEAANRKFGRINAAFHSALVLRDMRLERMDASDFQAALKPKVHGTVALARALRNEALDFLVFFSSAQSFSGNPAQSNYAAGCSFEDAFAQALRVRGLPAVVVNWGYWGEVGIVATSAHRRRMLNAGVHSIGTDEGMRALETILASRVPQAMAVKADDQALARLGVVAKSTSSQSTPAPNVDRLILAHDKLGALGARIALNGIQDMGAMRSAGEIHSADSLTSKLGIAPVHRALFKMLLKILSEQGYLEFLRDQWRTTPQVEIGRSDPSSTKAQLLTEYPEIGAAAELLFACLEKYPSILRGELAATEVLFPGSSMKLVSPVYQSDPLSSHLNRIASDLISTYVQSYAEPLHILEVGAGTGGTSTPVLQALDSCGKRIEYFYTDVSTSFLQHGKRQFGQKYPWVKFKKLNIEQDPENQDFSAHSFDVIIAANVLHATPRLRDTISHVAALLRPGGRLVLSETTAFSTFATLTFGLLEGWWLSDDSNLRLPGSPLADVDTWTRLLTEAGFETVRALGPNSQSKRQVGQRLIVGDLKKSTPAKVAPPSGSIPLADQASVEKIISQTVAEVLGHSTSSNLDLDRPFTDYGVDSLVLVELVTALNARLHVDMKPTSLFDYPNIRELAIFVLQEFGGAINAFAESDRRSHEPDIALLERLASGGLTLDETYLELAKGQAI